MKRRKISKATNRRIFKAGTKTKKINLAPKVMRGGTRL